MVRCLLLVIPVLLVLPGCSGSDLPPRADGEGRGRVLVTGIDGASIELVAPLMEEGRLPTIRELP